MFVCAAEHKVVLVQSKNNFLFEEDKNTWRKKYKNQSTTMPYNVTVLDLCCDLAYCEFTKTMADSALYVDYEIPDGGNPYFYEIGKSCKIEHVD